ncbi:MAG: hypothetical protein SOI56_01185 [Eubacteriales bacterium]|jgi:lysylphosphatidylglycerol synthetase-like protein (DUF2156 family)
MIKEETSDIREEAPATPQEKNDTPLTPEERAHLEQEKDRLQQAQSDCSMKIGKAEFMSSLMKGVTVLGLVLLILSVTLSFFIQNFIWFGIVFAIITVVCFIIHRRKLKASRLLRRQKVELREEFSVVCDRLDGREHTTA